MNYYISDPHFGHAKVIPMCNRPFETIDAMNECLIENWRRIVAPDDTVYVLGDVIYRNSRSPDYYLKPLPGRKHLILGNHDTKWMRQCDPLDFFESISHMKFVNEGDRQLTLCHFPMMSWPGSSRQGYMIFGHIHNNTDGAYWPLIACSSLMLNACVEVNGYCPVSFEQLKVNNAMHKAQELQKHFHAVKDNENDILCQITKKASGVPVQPDMIMECKSKPS